MSRAPLTTHFRILAAWLIAACLAMPAAAGEAIVVVPGFLGSRLVDAQGRAVWGSASQTLRRFPALELESAEGQSQLRPDGILHELHILGPFSATQYQGLVEFLNDVAAPRGIPVAEFAYDWRRSGFFNAKRLAEFLETPDLAGRDITLVAHSMGGLVSLAYLHEEGGSARVKRFITLGTPFEGAVNALDLLVSGWGSAQTFLLGGKAAVERVVTSFPAIFELLPSYENCCLFGRMFAADNEPFGALDLGVYERFGWITARRSSPEGRARIEAALASARRLRELARKPLPPGIERLKVAGDLIDTRAKFYVDPATGATQDRFFGGDGTVWSTSAANGDLQHTIAAVVVHAHIFEDPTVKIQLQRTIQGLPILDRFAAHLVSGSAETRNGELVPVIRVVSQAVPDVMAAGTAGELWVTILGEGEEPLADIDVKARLLTSPPQPIAVREHDGRYTAAFTAPANPGAYEIEIEVPELATVREPLLVAEPVPTPSAAPCGGDS